ncbi:MAG: DMT family transporter [Lachnospiraceae bacterium]|nr:DMT family transporter [Lachnospiraceae bacterium]
MWGFIIALISGALMSVQGVFNTEVTKQTGAWLTNSWVQLSGFLVCIVGWFLVERNKVNISELFRVDDKYMLLGGVIGAFITWTVIQSMGQLGPAKAVLTIVISQVAVAYLIELFGVFGVERAVFEMRKLIGILVAIAGLIVFKWE